MNYLKYKYQKQPFIFCKSRNRTHTAFSFFGWFASQNRAKSGKSFIFYAYTKNISHDFEKSKSKTPPAGQVCKSQNQNKKTYANTLIENFREKGSGEAHSPFREISRFFEKPCWKYWFKSSWRHKQLDFELFHSVRFHSELFHSAHLVLVLFCVIIMSILQAIKELPLNSDASAAQ